jgi:hypothetical protein
LDDVPKFHLVNWKVFFPIHFGELGIVSLSILNQALLGKWLWRFAVEKGVMALILGFGMIYGVEIVI